MKYAFVILSMIFYLSGTSLSFAAKGFCPADGNAVSILLAKEDDDKKDGEESNPEEDCE